MNTTKLINAVSAHLHNLNSQKHTICAENLACAIVAAAHALGMNVCGGLYDPDTQTRILYIG